jgi:parallel beta-helix repeat protein
MKRLKNILIVCIVSLLLFSTVSSTTAYTGSGTRDGEIILNYSFERPAIKAVSHDSDEIRILGLPTHAPPGAPMMPLKTVKILIPDGMEVDDIRVTADGKRYLGKFLIEPAQKPVPIGAEGEMTPLNVSIYNSMSPYPEKIYSEVGVQYKNGYQILILNLYPVEYIPASRDVSLFEGMSVVVETKPAPPSELFRGSPEDRAEILEMVDNPEEAGTYNRVVKSGRSADPTFDYVIITDEELKNASTTPNFHDLIDWKRSKGLNATIVTTETIYATYTGIDDQTKIRNFIRHAYLNWGVKYVLLGGDADNGDLGGESGDEIVPARELWSFDGAGIVADLYYACLDGDYDYDGDCVYGEPGDGDQGGEVDLMAEVYVGRAPVDTPSEVSNFVSKTISYESTPPDDPYLMDTWMLGELLWEDIPCPLEEAMYRGNVSEPDEKLNILRELRDKSLKGEYVDLYYDYSPEVRAILLNDPGLLFDAACLIAKYMPAVKYVIDNETGEDLRVGENDVKEIISFTNGLKSKIREREEEIGIDRSQDMIRSIEEFEEEVSTFEGKRFSDALRSSIYFEERRDADSDMDGDPDTDKGALEESGGATWGGDYKDEIKDGSCSQGYCTAGFPDGYNRYTLYDRDLDGGWQKSEAIRIIGGNTHLINHLGHANVGIVLKMDNSDVDALTNDRYFFGYSQGCYAGSFDNKNSYGYTTDYDCIIEHFVTSPGGAFGFIANSRYGWGEKHSTNGPSQYFDREFWDAIFGEDITDLGRANQDSKEDNLGFISDNYMRYCYYELNLFGDPETSIHIHVPEHDIDVVALNIPIRVMLGSSIVVNATIKNRGSEDESSVEIQLLENGTVCDTKILGNLPCRSSTVVNFIMSGDEPGDHLIGVCAVPVSGETSVANNCKEQIVRVTRVCTVDDDGQQFPNANYTSIQEAIDCANDYDIIEVYPGSYGCIVIDKSVDVIGRTDQEMHKEMPTMPVIDGGKGGDTVTIQASDVELRGFEITNSGDENAGIKMNGSNNILIEGNWVHSNDAGIGMSSSSNNIISGNTIELNNYGIIYDRDSTNNGIFRNNISSNSEYGVYIRSSDGTGILPSNNIHHNNFMDNNQNAKDEIGEDDVNRWYNLNLREGNYWSDHICTGNPSNGSQPYHIGGDGRAVDRYPFADVNGWLPILQRGDLNSDGEITPTDAAIALRIAASGGYDDVADVSRDGRITSLDALMILQAAAGRIEL